jgi:hypothetical protein
LRKASLGFSSACLRSALAAASCPSARGECHRRWPGRLCVGSLRRAVGCGYTSVREALPSGRAGRISLYERDGSHGSQVVAFENAATQIRERFL